MKSKRVTRLMACILATTMCTVPVFASNLQDLPQGAGQDFTSDVTVDNATLSVKVSPSFAVKFNPYYSGAAGTVSGQALTSDEFIISNNTSANGAAVKVLCTTTAQVKTKKPDVKLYYNTFTPDPASSAKKVQMNLKGIYGSGVQVSQNNYDSTGTQVSIPVTLAKTQIQMLVDGYGQANHLGAFAVQGPANASADWKDGDLNVSVAYKLRAVPSAMTVATVPNLTAQSTTSANILASDIEFASKSDLTAAIMKDASVFGLQFHSPDNLFDDITMTTADTTKVSITKTPDTANPETAAWSVKMLKSAPFLQGIKNNYEDYVGKSIDVVIYVDDGRRFVTKLTLN